MITSASCVWDVDVVATAADADACPTPEPTFGWAGGIVSVMGVASQRWQWAKVQRACEWLHERAMRQFTHQSRPASTAPRPGRISVASAERPLFHGAGPLPDAAGLGG